jgi:hypothetical protein
MVGCLSSVNLEIGVKFQKSQQLRKRYFLGFTYRSWLDIVNMVNWITYSSILCNRNIFKVTSFVPSLKTRFLVAPFLIALKMSGSFSSDKLITLA